MLLKLFLTFLVFLTPTMSVESACQKTELCDCQITRGKYEIGCFLENKYKTKVIIDPSLSYNSYSFFCDGSTVENIIWNMPKIQLGSFEKVELHNCLLSNKSVLAGLKNLHGFEQITILIINITITDKSRYVKNFQIAREHFNRLEDLESVYIIFSPTQNVLPLNLLKDLPNLRKLTLKGNFKEVPIGFFDSHKKLENIEIYSSLSVLPNITSLKNLKEIIINPSEQSEYHSTIERLPEFYFINMIKLEKVECLAKLKAIHETTFIGASNILDLSLQNNQLDNLPRKMLWDQKSLRALDLSNNKISYLDSDIFKHQILLVTLILSENKLTNLPADLLTNSLTLEYLDLGQNRLKRLSSNFKDAPSIGFFYLNDNELDFDDENQPFLNLGSQLVSIKLSNNLITSFPKGLMAAEKLDYLDLAHNKIQSISWNELNFIKKPMTIDLSHNKIKRIDKSGWLALTEADAKRSSSSDFEDFFILQEVFNLKTIINLDHNPLVCDCETVKFNTLPGIHFYNESLYCNEPETLHGQRLMDIEQKLLTCPLSTLENSTITCPSPCTCNIRPQHQVIQFNCSNLNLIAVPSLPDLSKQNVLRYIELDLSNNQIKHFPKLQEDPALKDVTELIIARNPLTNFDEENLPPQVQKLDLSDNHLKKLSNQTLEAFKLSETLNEIFLSGNSWECDCANLNLLNFIQSHSNITKDIDQVTCPDGEILFNKGLGDFCPKDVSIYVWLGAGFLLVLSVLTASVALGYMNYRQEIKILLYAKGWCMCFFDEDDLDEDKIYDAFVAFSGIDDKIVEEVLVPGLEAGEFPYRLCIHFRDWIPGELIVTQYVRSVAQSRKTIVILSKNFLQSEWCQAEFRTAFEISEREGRPRVIVVLYGDIGPTEELPEDLQIYIRYNTYLTYDETDTKFLDKLRYALGRPINMRKAKEGREIIAQDIIEMN